jgi:precorrin-6B methylase 1
VHVHRYSPCPPALNDSQKKKKKTTYISSTDLAARLREQSARGAGGDAAALIAGDPGKAGVSLASRKYLVVMRGATGA